MTGIETLREAARLMRERAEAVSDYFAGTPSGTFTAAWCPPADVEDEYIASWNPGVALAVADLLDAHVMDAKASGNQVGPLHPGLAIARVYLAALQPQRWTCSSCGTKNTAKNANCHKCEQYPPIDDARSQS